MTFKYYLLVFLLFSCSVYSQVGIGTISPNKSAMLEVVSSDKGLLIPKVQLKGVLDSSTIINGNVESLLVYNTATVFDVKPGFYYWANDIWNRIAVDGGVSHLEYSNAMTNIDGKVSFGGELIRPTTVTTSSDNTFAIKGLEKGDLEKDDLVLLDKSSGVFKRISSNSLFSEKQLLVLAKEGQTEFTAPISIHDLDKVSVYRNGVRVGFEMVQSKLIKLESGVVCNQDDEIRIVQFY